MPATMTSSCSLINVIALLPGQNAVTCLLFFVSWTRTAFRMAEFGCFASSCLFSSTMPRAIGAPSIGSTFSFSLRARLTYHLLCHLCAALLCFSFLPVNRPRLFLPIRTSEGSALPSFGCLLTLPDRVASQHNKG